MALPPEVWLCVFDHATHVPDTLLPDVYAYTSVVGTIHTKSSHAAIRQALVTKRALVRVCKQWWPLAVPYLYRSIYVAKAHHLPSLLNTFVRSAAGSTLLSSARPLGEYTQRLDVAVRVRDHSRHADAEFNLLTALIPCMPHLSIAAFAFAPNYATPSTDILNNILSALQRSAASLRVLDWSLRPLSPSDFRVADLLAKCTQLRFLNCSRFVWSKELEHGGVPPSVTTLHLHILTPTQSAIANNYTIPNLGFPITSRGHKSSALHELILDLHRNVEHWEDLLHVYGPQLVSVQLCVPSLYTVDIGDHLELVARLCPRLSRLTLSGDRFSSFIQFYATFQSVTYLALRVCRAQSSKADFLRLCIFMGHVQCSLPSLQVVQLLNEENVQCLLKTHTKFAVRTFLPMLEAATFRLEDRSGVSLKDRLKKLKACERRLC